jgi:hypothetical protein
VNATPAGPRAAVRRAPPRRLAQLAIAAAAVFGAGGPAGAATRDEIRVYTDHIVEPGEFELELHFNTIPRRRASAPPAEGPTPLRGLIVTPELSYGLTPTLELEAGFYWPFVSSADGSTYRLSPHLRLKWLPRRAADPGVPEGQWYWGTILEWSATPYRPAESRSYVDVRPVLGWRNDRWLLAANLILEVPTGRGESRSPEIGPSVKAVRRMDGNWSLGAEYHGEYGRLRDLLPAGLQGHTLYLTVDFHQPFGMHLGIGRGLNAQSGGWSLKGSLELPFD